MKKIISIIVFGVLIIGAYLSYDHLFPYARPIEEALNTTKIQSITVSVNGTAGGQNTISEAAELLKIQSLINQAKPTRKMTLNETPAVSSYYIMEIQSGNWTRTCYVYEEHGKTYLDFPYEGVYHIDKKIADILR